MSTRCARRARARACWRRACRRARAAAARALPQRRCALSTRAVSKTPRTDAEQLLADVHERGGALRAHDAARIAALLDDIERHAAALYGRDAAQRRRRPTRAPRRAQPAHEVLRVSAQQVQRLTAAMHDVAAHLDALDADADTLRDLHARADALARHLEHHDALQTTHQARTARTSPRRVMQQAVQQARAPVAHAGAHHARPERGGAELDQCRQPPAGRDRAGGDGACRLRIRRPGRHAARPCPGIRPAGRGAARRHGRAGRPAAAAIPARSSHPPAAQRHRPPRVEDAA